MKVGAVIGKGTQIDLESGEIGLHSTPTVAKDVIIVGSSFREGLTVKSHNNTKGLVRAWDAKSGKLLWTFNTIPRPASSATTPGKRNRGRSTATPASGRRSRSTKSSASSTCRSRIRRRICYGGHRPGNNLFGDSLVCVDLKTGQRKWHFQVVHHPIWDFDLPGCAAARRHRRRRQADQGGRAGDQAGRSSTCSIASPVSRCGRSKSGRCRRPTCPARRPRRRSRSRPSRRPTRATASSRAI